MAKKIEGYIDAPAIDPPDTYTKLIASVVAVPFADAVRHVTLVLHDGPHERVFTESEVRAKDEDLKWALNWINNEAKHLREMGQPQEALEVALDMILERHGIVLDPQ